MSKRKSSMDSHFCSFLKSNSYVIIKLYKVDKSFECIRLCTIGI